MGFYTYRGESVEGVTFVKVYPQELVCIMGEHTNMGKYTHCQSLSKNYYLLPILNLK